MRRLPATHRFRGEVWHLPLSPHEYKALYYRAMTNSRKEAAEAAGISDTSERHALSVAFKKLQVTDINEAFRVMGWLLPVPWHEFIQQMDFEDDDPRPYVPWP